MTPEVPRSTLVGVVMGSKSDWETMRHAAEVLAELGVPVESKVVSAHRTPERLFQYGRDAEGRGLEVIIAGAGGAAHLPGMLAAISILPVLGVPVESKSLKGWIRCSRSSRCRAECPSARWPSALRGPPTRGCWPRPSWRGSTRPSARIWRGSARLRPKPWESRQYEREPQPAGSGRRSSRARAGSSVLYPPASLGVIGSGQLGRMFVQAGAADGLPRRRPERHRATTPAAQVAHWTVIGRPDHLPALRAFADAAEAVTVEFENVSAPALRWLARRRIGPARLADRLDQPEPAAREEASWRGTPFPMPPGGRSAPSSSWTRQSGRSVCP